MIYFLALREGGGFIRIVRKKSIRPTKLCRMLKGEKFIAVFKNGMIHDSFIKPYVNTTWRHPIYGGRREGKAYYKRLMKTKLPTEYIET